MNMDVKKKNQNYNKKTNVWLSLIRWMENCWGCIIMGLILVIFYIMWNDDDDRPFVPLFIYCWIFFFWGYYHNRFSLLHGLYGKLFQIFFFFSINENFGFLKWGRFLWGLNNFVEKFMDELIIGIFLFYFYGHFIRSKNWFNRGSIDRHARG